MPLGRQNSLMPTRDSGGEFLTAQWVFIAARSYLSPPLTSATPGPPRSDERNELMMSHDSSRLVSSQSHMVERMPVKSPRCFSSPWI